MDLSEWPMMSQATFCNSQSLVNTKNHCKHHQLGEDYRIGGLMDMPMKYHLLFDGLPSFLRILAVYKGMQGLAYFPPFS
jgi:hypothetical protein